MLYILLILFLPLLIGSFSVTYAFLHRKEYKNTALLFHSVSRFGNGISRYSPEKFIKIIEKVHLSGMKFVSIDTHVKSFNPNEIPLVFDDGFLDFYEAVFPVLERFGFSATIFPIVKTLESDFKWDVFAKKEHLTQKQIEEISKAGIEIGSHTFSHPDLRYLSDRDIEFELANSKKILEGILGKNITSVSFPFGSVNYRVWSIAKKCGYKHGVAYGGCEIKYDSDIIPSLAVYSFDNPDDIVKRIIAGKSINSFARALILPHFAKGTAVWNFRRNYSISNLFKKA